MDLLVPSSQSLQVEDENVVVNPFIEVAREAFQEQFGRMLTIQAFVQKIQFDMNTGVMVSM